AEGYVRRLLSAGTPASAEGVAAIGELVEVVRAAMAGLQSAQPRVPAAPALTARLAALRDRLPEPAPADLDRLAVGAMGDDDDDGMAPDTGAAAEEALADDAPELVDLDLSAYAGFDVPAPAPAVPEAGEPVAADDAIASLDAGTPVEIDAPADAAGPVAPHGPVESDGSHGPDAVEPAEPVESVESVDAAGAGIEDVDLAAVAALEARLLEQERVDSERFEAERLELEREAAERAAAERAEAERAEAERLEAERLEAERAEAERAEAERLEAERLAAGRPGAGRPAAERREADRRAAERQEAERLEAERREAERQEAERQEAERQEAERLEAERLEAERLEAARRAEADAVAAASRQLLEAIPLEPDPDAEFDFTGLDRELVEIFVEESRDLLDHSDGLLARLRESADDREAPPGLQRDLHTIKGGARMAGVFAIGELGHSMESLLEAVSGQRFDLGRGDVPLLERGFDRLHAMVTRVGEGKAISPSQALIEAFDARARGEELTPEALAAPGVRVPAPTVALPPLTAPMS